MPLGDLEKRVGALEQSVGDIRVEVQRLDDDLKTNTAVTAAIKSDTAEIVALIKGGRVFGKIVAWTVGTAAAFAGAWASIRCMK